MDEQLSGELSALLTDLYQLTMAACYFDQDMQAEATFSLFIRKYPAQRSYFVAAGLAEVVAVTWKPCTSPTTTWLISPPPASFRRPSWTS